MLIGGQCRLKCFKVFDRIAKKKKNEMIVHWLAFNRRVHAVYYVYVDNNLEDAC